MIHSPSLFKNNLANQDQTKITCAFVQTLQRLITTKFSRVFLSNEIAKRVGNDPTKPDYYFYDTLKILTQIDRVPSKVSSLTVKTVVDAVNNVFGSGLLNSESGLVLLDNILLSLGKSWDVVYISDRLVWSVGDDLSGGIWVHALNSEVGADIGVVQVNNLGSTEVGNILVVNLSVGSDGGDGSSTEGSGGTEESTTITLCVKSSLGRGLCVGGKRSGRAVGEIKISF